MSQPQRQPKKTVNTEHGEEAKTDHPLHTVIGLNDPELLQDFLGKHKFRIGDKVRYVGDRYDGIYREIGKITKIYRRGFSVKQDCDTDDESSDEEYDPIPEGERKPAARSKKSRKTGRLKEKDGSGVYRGYKVDFSETTNDTKDYYLNRDEILNVTTLGMPVTTRIIEGIESMTTVDDLKRNKDENWEIVAECMKRKKE